MKKIIFWFVVIGLIGYGEYKYFKLPIDDNPFFLVKPVRTGIVISNFSELENVKHGTKTDYYLKIQYGDSVEIHEVSGEVFYGSNVGTEIRLHETETLPLHLIVISLLNTLFCYFTPIILIIILIIWVFAPKYLNIENW